MLLGYKDERHSELFECCHQYLGLMFGNRPYLERLPETVRCG